MTVRSIGVGLIGIVLVVAGCTRSAPAPKPTVSEENQILSVIDRVSQGLSDPDTVAKLTCAKYRDNVSGPSADDVPPMTALPLDLFSSMPPDVLVEQLGEEYAGASEASVRALVDALLRRDEPAYKEAMAKVMAETMQIRVDKVENLKITGDTATADVTLVLSTGGTISRTSDAGEIELVKEDGRWMDCTPPG